MQMQLRIFLSTVDVEMHKKQVRTHCHHDRHFFEYILQYSNICKISVQIKCIFRVAKIL